MVEKHQAKILSFEARSFNVEGQKGDMKKPLVDDCPSAAAPPEQRIWKGCCTDAPASKQWGRFDEAMPSMCSTAMAQAVPRRCRDPKDHSIWRPVAMYRPLGRPLLA